MRLIDKCKAALANSAVSAFSGWMTIDVFLLDQVFQRIVNECSRRFGWHFIAIAEFNFAAALAFWTANIVRVAKIDATWMFDPFVCFSALVGFALTGMTFMIVKGVVRDLRDGFANPARWRLVTCRFGFSLNIILFVIPPITEPLIFGYWALITCGCYFISCQEGPPRERRRARQLVTEDGAA